MLNSDDLLSPGTGILSADAEPSALFRRDSQAAPFDGAITQDYLTECTTRVAAPGEVREARTDSILIFQLGKEWLALPTGIFQEVVEQYVVRTVPHRRSDVLRGVTSVRGELLLCVSLEALLKLEGEPGAPRQPELPGRLLVCNRQGDRLAFRADAIYGVHRYRPKDLMPVPVTLSKASAGSVIAGVLRWGEQTVGCLDDERLFVALNQGLG